MCVCVCVCEPRSRCVFDLWLFGCTDAGRWPITDLHFLSEEDEVIFPLSRLNTDCLSYLVSDVSFIRFGFRIASPVSCTIQNPAF